MRTKRKRMKRMVGKKRRKEDGERKKKRRENEARGKERVTGGVQYVCIHTFIYLLCYIIVFILFDPLIPDLFI